MKQEQDDGGKSQAAAQYRSIAAMVAALQVDRDRLEELQELEERKHLDGPEIDELKALTKAAAGPNGEWETEEDTQDGIQEDPLTVEVRSDWHAPGSDNTPAQFRILLCTGGPAVQIRGELDEHCQPARAWLEYQDWGTPWTQFFDAEQDVLLAYAQQFYFGE